MRSERQKAADLFRLKIEEEEVNSQIATQESETVKHDFASTFLDNVAPKRVSIRTIMQSKRPDVLVAGTSSLLKFKAVQKNTIIPSNFQTNSLLSSLNSKLDFPAQNSARLNESQTKLTNLLKASLTDNIVKK